MSFLLSANGPFLSHSRSNGKYGKLLLEERLVIRKTGGPIWMSFLLSVNGPFANAK